MSEQQPSWSPRDEANPFRVLSFKTNEEWLEISRWYPFSVRVLVTTTAIPQWHEQARTATWDQAQEIIKAMGHSHHDTRWLPAWVVMKCERRGKEGREHPVLWYPSEGEW